MTVDMLAATFFWPEGTLLHIRDGGGPDGNGEDVPLGDGVVDPLVQNRGETFWATVLRQIGWPLPSKPKTHA